MKKIYLFIYLIVLTVIKPVIGQQLKHQGFGIYTGNLTENIIFYTIFGDKNNQISGSANGIIWLNNNKAILFEAPNDEFHTRFIINYIRDSLKAELQIAVVSHTHKEAMGGAEELKRNKIPIYGSELTTAFAKMADITRPDIIFEDSLSLNFGGKELFLFCPGPGHTADNLLAWIPSEKVLFAGNFVKDTSTHSFNGFDGFDPYTWINSIGFALRRCQNIEIIVPGQGLPDSNVIFLHTLKLLEGCKL